MPLEPFTIHVTDEALHDLKDRLTRTRWPDAMDNAGWDYGTDRDWLRELVTWWIDDYDWRAEEQRLNELPQFTATIDDVRLHVIHRKGTGPAAVPLLVLHGWPSSFVQMLDILPMLADPAATRADPADSFDVVIASLPGFGFSTSPTNRKMTYVVMADLFHRLMTDVLGYRRYGIRASDVGTGVMTQMALAHPDAIIGIHQSGSSGRAGEGQPSPEEQAFLDRAQTWSATERGYVEIQETRPQTLAYGLNDSPVALAAWILEKFHAWSDGDLDVIYRRADLVTNVAVYWFTQTINSSIRTYRDDFDDWIEGRPDVPTGHLREHGGPPASPRERVEREWRVDHWTQAPRGGHFLEWEQPAIVAEDLRAFFQAVATTPGTIASGIEVRNRRSGSHPERARRIKRRGGAPPAIHFRPEGIHGIAPTIAHSLPPGPTGQAVCTRLRGIDA